MPAFPAARLTISQFGVLYWRTSAVNWGYTGSESEAAQSGVVRGSQLSVKSVLLSFGGHSPRPCSLEEVSMTRLSESQSRAAEQAGYGLLHKRPQIWGGRKTHSQSLILSQSSDSAWKFLLCLLFLLNKWSFFFILSGRSSKIWGSKYLI